MKMTHQKAADLLVSHLFAHQFKPALLRATALADPEARAFALEVIAGAAIQCLGQPLLARHTGAASRGPVECRMSIPLAVSP